MSDPRTQLATFSLALPMDNISHPESVQPVGAKPRLVASINTRLTKVPGVVSKAPGVTVLQTTGTGYGSSPRGGIIPHGRLDSTANHSNDELFSRRISGSGLSTIKSITGTSNQNAFYPAQVLSAGQLPGTSQAFFNPSVAYVASTGFTYFVSLRCVGGLTAVCLVVLADDGREVIPSTDLVTLAQAYTDTRNWAAVTAHGSTVLLWYAAGGAGGLNVCTLTVDASALTATIGTPSVVYTQTLTGVLGALKTQLAYDENDTTSVYLAAPHSANANQLRVMKIDVATRTVTTGVDLVPAGAFTWVSIAYLASTAVLVAVSVNGAGVTEVEYGAALGAPAWTQVGALYVGQVATGFQHRFGAVYRVFAVSRVAATFDSTHVQYRDGAGALLAGASGVIPHQTMVGHIATQRDAAGLLHALIPVQVCYRPENAIDSYLPTDTEFVPDPSIEIVRMDMTWNAYTSAYMLQPSIVARLGTDFAIRYPGSLMQYDYTGAAANQMFTASPRSMIASGSKALVTYLEDSTADGVAGLGYAIRYAWLSFDSLQPRLATSGDGTVVVAGALPAVWDGQEVTEFSPLRVPVLTGTTGGGSGAALTGVGPYLFAVVVSWRDAQGNIHRSSPSSQLSLAGAGMQPTLTVKMPMTLRNLASQYGVQVTFYASDNGGTTLYAQPWFAQLSTTLAPGALVATVTNVVQPVIDAFHPAIYTDGSATQEVAAFAPNACLDATVVSERLWLLDAEHSSRWWYSKPRVIGYWFEMSPDQYVDLPANAGAGVATAELNGAPLFFSSKGVWTVSGEGPDALLQPPEFSSPLQVSDVACTQRNSVVRTPVGVMFVSNNRFVVFAGQPRELDFDALAYGTVIGTAVFRRQNEVCFVMSSGYCVVYNWVADGFTVWDTTVTGFSSITGAAQCADGTVLLCNAGQVSRLDPETVSSAAQISITTGHIALGDKQDLNTLQNLVLHAKRSGTHALGVTIGVDYTTPADAKSWSSTDIANSVTGVNTYDAYAEPAAQSARAVQLVIAESGSVGEAFQPVSCTLEVIKKPGKATRSLPPSARK